RTLLTAQATLTSGSNLVTLSNPAIVEIGWLVQGPGIPSGATIVAKTGTKKFTLSANATQSGVKTLTFNDSVTQEFVAATLTKGNKAVTLGSATGVKAGWL